MKKDIKDMSVGEIFKLVGKLLTPENIFYILKDDNDGSQYEEVYMQIKNDPRNNIDTLYEYVIENEDIIDKEILVLLTLQNYIEYRNDLDDFNTHQRYMYENRIETCKRLLENKDVATYGFLEDAKTGRIEDIVEISSVELCAETNSEKIQLYPEQVKINRQRKDKYNQRNQKNKKTIHSKQKRLAEIEKDFDLKNILQFINLSDFDDLIITERKVAGIIKNMILRNGVIKSLNLDHKGIIKLLDTNEFYDLIDTVDLMTYIDETENAIKGNIQFFDLEKMLLCSAYRAVEKVSLEEFEEDEIDNIKTILLVILNRLQGKNLKLVGEIEDIKTNERIQIEYDIDKLKKDILKFADKGIFLTEEKTEDIKNSLMNGDKNLKDFNPNLIWQLGFEEDEWDKLVKMSSENFIFFIDECEPIEEDVKEVILEINNISTECLYKLIQRGSITPNEIIEVCNGEKVRIEQLIELATVDLVEDNTIIDVFNALKEQKNDELLVNDLLLEYFDIEKIKEYINSNKIDDKFLEFYNNIIPEDEEERNNILNKINELIPEIEDKSIIIKFYNAKFISQEKLIEIVNDNDILELYETGKINVDIANKLNKEGIIEQDTMALIIDEEYKTGDIMKGLEEGIIDLSIVLELYPDRKIYGTFKKYTEGIFKSPNPAIYAFMTSNMEIEEIDKLYKKGIVKEQDLKYVIMQGNISKAKITELYLNMLISQEIIDELHENQILTDSDTELMKKALGMKNIVKNMDKSLGIAFGSDGEIEIDDGIFLPEEKVGKKEREYDVDYFPNGNKTKELKKVISPAIRERKFEMYGAKRVKRNNVEYNEKSPFNDYEFYIIPDEKGNITPECIVIAERYYKDKYSGEEKLIDKNATYLFELKDLTRISKKSKKEILSEMKEANDKRMKRKKHSKKWSENMDKALEKLLGRKLESCYTESEIHDIRTMTELIDGFEDKGKIYRMFDIEFY